MADYRDCNPSNKPDTCLWCGYKRRRKKTPSKPLGKCLIHLCLECKNRMVSRGIPRRCMTCGAGSAWLKNLEQDERFSTAGK